MSAPYLVCLATAGMPAWEDGEIAELHMGTWAFGDVNWHAVAEASVAAVESGLGMDDDHLDAWCAFGQSRGLSGNDDIAFTSLYVDPICVAADDWVNGRHRSRAMQQAGVARVAAAHPDYVPSFLRRSETN
ncbi:hypothetical protein KIN34_14370 [Cellulomonas sp. DKR-3]|uniref:Uncharacterized protein n=1 Tax=Cellulomonas fulva TaxID=2835530 RepID=A0ABS5U243_9CELL|nr:hypothetical protein [Cellulomonas fulva]MBT0995468.1 hypothetical protein [Cellulomonas fulva]